MWYNANGIDPKEKSVCSIYICVRPCMTGCLPILSLAIGVVIVYVCLFTHGHAHCLDIETFIVKLSEVSERAEMDISLCDSQRSNCQPSP